MEELISVIVSVHNVEAFLPRCLDSLSFQSYQNLEILLIDDGSTDRSGFICDEYAAKDPRARVIHQENQGLWAVRNRGQSESRGEYLLFPDGDDYFHKDYIQLLYEAINYGGKKHPLAICDYQVTLESNEDILSETPISFEEIAQPELLEKITSVPSSGEALWGANWNKLYRKNDLPIPFQRNFPRCQDFDSNLRLFFLVHNAVFVDKVLYFWRMHPGQITKAPQDDQLRCECRTRIILDALSDTPREFHKYRPGLLTVLYTRLVLWEDVISETDHECRDEKIIRLAERKTFLEFLFSRSISWSLKAHLIFALHFPKIRKAHHRFIRRSQAYFV